VTISEFPLAKKGISIHQERMAVEFQPANVKT